MIAEVIESTNRARDEDFLEGLATEGFLERSSRSRRSTRWPPRCARGSGNTTHISVMDAEGGCASVTCSNGSCSGVIVPGTGVHLNNMLGEQDLNPLGFHRHEPGARVPSMMAPTVVLRDGRPEIAIGSAGLEPDPLGDPPDRARRRRPRAAGAGGGVRAAAARRGGARWTRSRAWTRRPSTASSRRAGRSRRWSELNLFFGGVQAVARNPGHGPPHGRRRPAPGGVARWWTSRAVRRPGPRYADGAAQTVWVSAISRGARRA